MVFFRSYDARGIYGKDVDESLAEKTGKAFGTLYPGKIAVGGDVRKSTPSLKQALIKGLVSTGAHVIDIGDVTTPMVCFAIKKLSLDGGISVSASHNPKEYNGFKFYHTSDAHPISYEKGLGKIEELTKSQEFKSGNGSLETRDVSQDYTNFISSQFQSKLKVVIDAGNGVAGLIAPKVFRALGCEVIELYCEPDGDFPNHAANPSKRETLKELQAKVLESRANFGVAFDGDGDRIGFVNQRGEIIENNTVFAILIKHFLAKYPGGKVVFDVLSSKMIEDLVKSLGGIPIPSRVGHSYIHVIMHEHDCALGGENSAHYFFKDSFGYDDAIYAGAAIASILSKKSLEELTNNLPKYQTAEEKRFECADERKFQVIDSLKERFASQNPLTLDGLKVFMDDGWFIIRASNTQPALVTRAEAKSQETLGKIQSTMLNALEEELGELRRCW